MAKQVAIISPVSLLETFSTRLHLVLAQYYLNNRQYRDFYVTRRLVGDFVILDQGAAELKTSIDNGLLAHAAIDLRPELVIAPDVIYDTNETLRRTESFLVDYWPQLRDLGIGIMAVPQGATISDWYDCYEKFNADPRISWLGISMFCAPVFGKRSKALKLIAPTVQRPCHLLGLWDNPYDLLEERKFDFVKSVDTAKPIEFAIEGLTLTEWIEHKHIDDDWYFLTEHSISALMTWNVADFTRLFEEGI